MKAEDLNKALGAFLICFGQGLPAELKNSIRHRCHAMAEAMDQAGDTNVATLTRDLGDALAMPVQSSSH